MTRANEISEEDIVAFYMEYVVANDNRPTSIEEFTESQQFDTTIFENHFRSFKDLERTIYKMIFENSLVILMDSSEFRSFSKKDKLLSLYFTFFENISLNRDYFKITLKGLENQLKALSVFSKFRPEFLAFVEELDLEPLNLNIDSIENIQKKTIKESAWIQFLFTMKFWLDDTSEDFEKTDIFIEKSINTSFELLDNKSLHTFIDLAKFLYQEKIK